MFTSRISRIIGTVAAVIALSGTTATNASARAGGPEQRTQTSAHHHHLRHCVGHVVSTRTEHRFVNGWLPGQVFAQFRTVERVRVKCRHHRAFYVTVYGPWHAPLR